MGLKLLSAILQNVEARVLREIDPDLLLSGRPTEPEKRVYHYIRQHYEENNALPDWRIVLENTGITLPEADQPTNYYMRRVRQRAFAQGLHDPYRELAEGLQNPKQSIATMADAIEQMNRLRMQFIARETGIETQDSLLEAVQYDFEYAQEHQGSLRGITTGFPELDEVLGGYQNQDLIVWVARPGRAKSWMLLKQCHAAWVAGFKPLYISNEMGGLQNMRRIIGLESGINPTFIREGRIQTLSLPRFYGALDRIRERPPLHMATANFSRTVEQVAVFVDEYKPDICYIDAGYLLTPRKVRYGSSGRRESISDVIEELDQLSNDAGIPFVITVQFNRTADQRRRSASRRGGTSNPLSHLGLDVIGETDAISRSASHVLGLDLPPSPLPQHAYRVFGFLKGREGEDGWWVSSFMETKTSPIDIRILPRTDPVYEAIMRGMPSNNRAENVNPSRRTELMRLNRRR